MITKAPERKPLRMVGAAGIGAWCGVDARTVSSWLQRYDDTPTPDAEINPGRHGIPDRAWLDTPARRKEWLDWMKTRPGRGAPGVPRGPRAAAQPAGAR